MNSFVSLNLIAITVLLTCSGCNQPTAAETKSAADSLVTAETTSSQGTKARVVAGTPQRKTLTLYTTQPGRILPYEEAPLSPRVTGYIEELKVDIGDVVEPKQVLLTISVPELRDEEVQMQALIKQAEADVARATAAIGAAKASTQTAEAKVAQAEAGAGRSTAEYELANSEYNRIKELVENGSVTAKLLDESTNRLQSAAAAREELAAEIRSAQAMLAEAQANVKKAEADEVAANAKLKVAQANLARTRTMLSFAEIKAPFAGVITRRTVDTGHFVQPASGRSMEPLLVVTCFDKVRVAVDVPELEASLVTSGKNADTATVRVQALNVPEFTGTVSRTGWSLDGTNRSLRVEIDLTNEKGLLRPGMYANVTILLGTASDALVIPTTSVIREGQKTWCAKVVGGKVERVPVELGLRSGNEIVVLAGLTESDSIVVIRPESLATGAPVEAVGTAAK